MEIYFLDHKVLGNLDYQNMHQEIYSLKIVDLNTLDHNMDLIFPEKVRNKHQIVVFKGHIIHLPIHHILHILQIIGVYNHSNNKIKNQYKKEKYLIRDKDNQMHRN